MMATEFVAGDAVEGAVFEHEFHVFVWVAVLPEGGGVARGLEGGVGDVAPAVGADVIDAAAEVAAGVVGTAVVAPEGERVAAFGENVAVEDDDAVGGSAGHCYGVGNVVGAGVFEGDVLEDEVASAECEGLAAGRGFD